jgi:dienelactone hydrolase
MYRIITISLLFAAIALPLAAQDKDKRLTTKPKDYNGKFYPWAPPATKEAWEARRAVLKEQLLVSQGLLPLPEKVPLNAVVHGKIERDGYTVEKVFFVSHPGHYITGNLYRPTKPGKHPAVLYTHGHWQDARLSTANSWKTDQKTGAEATEESSKYFHQAGCAMLARLGCVVFHYDMVGNSDSKQIGHRQGFTDIDALLRLQTFMNLQTWNSVRVVDFLLTLPEVDPSRIGITGASGGGTQSFVLAACDDRVAASFPAVMVSTAMQGGCICENDPYLRVNTTNIELAALIAPRPLGMTGAKDWTVDIETKGLPELKTIYKMYGADSKVMAAIPIRRDIKEPFPHNYNQPSREVMYNFFAQNIISPASAAPTGPSVRYVERVSPPALFPRLFPRLRSRNIGTWEETPAPVPSPAQSPRSSSDKIVELPFKPVDPKQLSVYDADHPLPKDATNAEGLKRYLTDMQEKQAAARLPKDKASLAAYQKLEHAALRAMMVDDLPATSDIDVTPGAKTEKGGVTTRAMVISRKGQGERVNTLIVSGKEFDGRGVIWVHPDGIASLWKDDKLVPAAQAIVDKGAGILAVDVYRTGANAKEPSATTNMKIGNNTYAGYFFGYNRSLLSERVHDILTAVAFVKSYEKTKSIHLVGFEKAGPWVLLARGLCGDAVARTAVDVNDFRFEQVKDFDHEMMQPGALKYGGLMSLAATIAPRELYLCNSKGAGSAEPLLAAYRAAGHSDRLSRHEAKTSPQQMIEWILR